MRIAMAALLLSGCSDSTAPGTRLAGTFDIHLQFDGRPGAVGNGTITFEQPDANDPTLQISGSFTATPINGTLTTFRDATLSTDNAIRFRVEAPFPWQFEGTLSGEQLITGRHTLVGGGLSGIWTARKLVPSGPGPVSAR